MSIDYSSLSLTDFIALQEEISRELRQRFEKRLALVFADVVGSTAYFERYGAAAGTGLLQRFYRLLEECMAPYMGRLVDTAGDGAFVTFTQALLAAVAMIDLQNKVMADNEQVAPEHRLSLRIGIHYGLVLTDGEVVRGDAVNLAARICSACEPDEIRVSEELAYTLPPNLRLRCRTLPAQELKGIPQPVTLSRLEWRDPAIFPSRVQVRETGQQHDIPNGETVRFGRLDVHQGRPANEVVLSHPDPAQARRISRWQFELRRRSDGYQLVPVSRAPTELDGQVVPMGQQRALRAGSTVKLSRVLTLDFLAEELDTSMGATIAWDE